MNSRNTTPVKLSERITAWHVQSIREWMEGCSHE